MTVFVGNITERAPELMMRQILSSCGLVLNWKRVLGASGKLQGENDLALCKVDTMSICNKVLCS